MNRYKLLLLPVLLLCLAACQKGDMMEKYRFVKLQVTSQNYVNVPVLHVFANDQQIFRLHSGEYADLLTPLKVDIINLSVRDSATGEVYLDSTFTPKPFNNFNVLVDNTVGIRRFNKIPPDPATPISKDSMRIQFLHRIEVGGRQRNVTFKIMKDSSTTLSAMLLEEVAEIKNVPYGQPSIAKDIFINKFTSGPYKGRTMTHRLRAVDAETGEVLVELFKPSGNLNVNAGTGYLYNCITKADESFPNGITWSFNTNNRYPILQ